MNRLKYRRECLENLREVGIRKARLLLSEFLTDSDGEYRCEAALLTLLLGSDGIPLVLPLLRDPEQFVRWHVSGHLGDLGDDTAIDPLIEVLKSDSDPQVRGQAVSALGRRRSARAIPSLLAALEKDKEVDALGFTPSFLAAQALDDILGTQETRIKYSDGICQMAPWEPDMESLKKRAQECYAQWVADARP